MDFLSFMCEETPLEVQRSHFSNKWIPLILLVNYVLKLTRVPSCNIFKFNKRL